MDLITCMIIDDEPFARKGIKGYVEKTDFLALKAECEDALELGQRLHDEPVDLLFLDIQMPHLTGVDFIRSLKNPPKVIFTTAFKEFAIDGFELDVLDYLLKPISFERFMKAAYKAKDYFDLRKTKQKPEYLFIKVSGRLEKILFRKILYIEGLENYIIVHTEDQNYITHSTLKAFKEKIPDTDFLQIHKSYIISTDKVTAIDANNLKIGPHTIPISRTLKDMVMEKITLNKHNI